MFVHEVSMEVETPLGRGQTLFVDGNRDEQYWTVVLNDNGAFVTFRQKKLRACRDYTVGRMMSDAQMREIVGGIDGKELDRGSYQEQRSAPPQLGGTRRGEDPGWEVSDGRKVVQPYYSKGSSARQDT